MYASSLLTGKTDPRVTRIGKIIRELHLDELPQLVNVIRGEMNLVGPRPFHPLVAAELESTLPHFGLRHLVKPGITGWAPIRCDYAACLENRAEVFARDFFYIKHASVLFDLRILLKTVRVCIWRRECPLTILQFLLPSRANVQSCGVYCASSASGRGWRWLNNCSD